METVRSTALLALPVPVVLASASPTRRRLLAQVVARFDVVPSHVPERTPAGMPPEDVPAYLAGLKAHSVSHMRRRALIIGADTIGICEGRILGKPRDRADGVRMLRMLCRAAHEVLTGLCLLTPDGRERTLTVSTRIRMRRLGDAEIERLVDLPGALQAAGAYCLQEVDPNVESIDGSASNVMGLPLEALRAALREWYG
jgi:nucleoside triphosphate pyrophosphatase